MTAGPMGSRSCGVSVPHVHLQSRTPVESGRARRPGGLAYSAAVPIVPIAFTLAGLMGVIGGVAGLVAAWRRWRREQRATDTHRVTTGRVVERYLPRGSQSIPAAPSYTIEFTTPAGQAVRFSTDSVAATPQDVGSLVDVRYDPSHPEDAFVRGGERLAAIIFGMAGAVFGCIGVLMLLTALELVFH
jgi:hypothetical protein